jgi:hypothetical protein
MPGANASKCVHPRQAIFQPFDQAQNSQGQQTPDDQDCAEGLPKTPESKPTKQRRYTEKRSQAGLDVDLHSRTAVSQSAEKRAENRVVDAPIPSLR